jgi:hypothetical protein
VLTSEQHNFPLLRDGLAHAAARSPLELRLYPGRMTHMKALLVDPPRASSSARPTSTSGAIARSRSTWRSSASRGS